MAVKRKSRGSRKPRRSSRSSRRSTKLVDPSAKRVGSPHEEHIRGLGSYCNVCGYIDDANPSDPLIRKWHSDSFGDSRRPSHRRHGNAVPQFNRGEEVTVIRPTRMDIGRGKQMYQPGSIYGTISQLTPSAALVFWYQHPNAPTWHNFEDLKHTGGQQLFTAPRPTRYASLGYAHVEPKLWRLFDITGSRPKATGPHYRTRTELMGDLDRYADESGHADESRRAR